MNVGDLKNFIKDLPDETPVQVDVEVESGFYDVPARHAQGVLCGLVYDDYKPHERLIIRGSKK